MSELTGPVNSHIKPEPIEAPEPRPVTGEQLVRSRALQAGWRALCADGPALVSYASWTAAVEAYEEYLQGHSGFGSWRRS